MISGISRAPSRRRLLQRAAGGAAAILALSRAPAIAQAVRKKLVMAHIVAPPESSAVAFTEMAEAVNKNANSGIEIEFHAAQQSQQNLAYRCAAIAVERLHRIQHGRQRFQQCAFMRQRLRYDRVAQFGGNLLRAVFDCSAQAGKHPAAL